MVFELDTSDMERHSVELRLYLEKAARRFEKAQMKDAYERIVKSMLPQMDLGGPSVLQIDQLSSAEEARRLSSFLARLIETCNRIEHHERLQSALRDSLYQSRRKSISIGSQLEPLCFFCAGGVCPAENQFDVDGLADHQFPAIELVVAGRTANEQRQQRHQPASCPPAAATRSNNRQQAQAFFGQFYDEPSLTPPPDGEMRISTPTGLATPVSILTTTPHLDGEVQDLSTRKGIQTNNSNGIKRKLQLNDEIDEDVYVDVQTDGDSTLPAAFNTPSGITAGGASRHLAALTTSQSGNGISSDSGANSGDDEDHDDNRSIGPLAIDEQGAPTTNLNSSVNEETPSSGEPAPVSAVGHEVKRLKIEMIEEAQQQQTTGVSQRSYSSSNGLRSGNRRDGASNGSRVCSSQGEPPSASNGNTNDNSSTNRRSSQRRSRPYSSKSLSIKKPRSQTRHQF